MNAPDAKAVEISTSQTLVRIHFGIAVLLTCVAIQTCVRIEVANASYGFYLPRKDFGTGNPKWRVASQSAIQSDFETRIAREHQSEFMASHPGEPVPDENEFRGIPFTASQQATLTADLDDSLRRSTLRDLVGTWGLLQYVVAPAALLVSTVIAIASRSNRVRILAACGCVINVVCLCLMVYRGYFPSLGW